MERRKSHKVILECLNVSIRHSKAHDFRVLSCRALAENKNTSFGEVAVIEAHHKPVLFRIDTEWKPIWLKVVNRPIVPIWAIIHVRAYIAPKKLDVNDTYPLRAVVLESWAENKDIRLTRCRVHAFNSHKLVIMAVSIDLRVVIL